MKKIGLGLGIVVGCMAAILVFVLIERNQILKFETIAYESGQEIKKQIDRGLLYGPYMKVKKNTNFYEKKNGIYQKKGTIDKGIIVPLEKSDFKEPYFQVKKSSTYLAVDDLEKVEFQTERALSYLPFAEVITIKEGTKLSRGNSSFDIPEAGTYPVYVKTKDQYGIMVLEQLFYVSQQDVTVVETKEIEPSISEMAVLNYHFFYDKEAGETCPAGPICHDVKQFESHLDYMTKEHYLTVTMHEFEQFIDGEIRLPEKSVLLTIDDGAQGVAEKAIPLLEKYDVQASLFLITGWFDYHKFNSDHLELHSHTNLMHTTGVCPGGQGGGIKCLPHDDIQKDLKTTRDLLNNTTTFAYPFYEYSESAIANLKEAGFTMAFIGGGRRAKVGQNKMLIPRFGIDTSTTVAVLKAIL